MMRKLRAEIRKANYRLACIAAQEKLNEERSTAKKSLREMPPAEPIKEVPGKKGKKEKKEEPSPASETQEGQRIYASTPVQKPHGFAFAYRSFFNLSEWGARP